MILLLLSFSNGKYDFHGTEFRPTDKTHRSHPPNSHNNIKNSSVYTRNVIYTYII